MNKTLTFVKLISSGLIAYLIGSLNFAIIFSLHFKKQDIRKHGSKNAGSTNVVRVFGPLAGILVFCGDFLKSIIAFSVCDLLFKNSLLSSNTQVYDNYGHLIVGLLVILGHLYPIYFNFRGGKGIATAAGVILIQDIRYFLFVLIIFLLSLILFRIVALASICAAISYPISTMIFFQNYLIFLFSLLVSALVIYAHRSNIKKLLLTPKE